MITRLTTVIILYINAEALYFIIETGFPGDSVVKNPPANSGDVGSLLGLGRLPIVGNGNSLLYSCLGNPMAWAEGSGSVQSMQS